MEEICFLLSKSTPFCQCPVHGVSRLSPHIRPSLSPWCCSFQVCDKGHYGEHLHYSLLGHQSTKYLLLVASPMQVRVSFSCLDFPFLSHGSSRHGAWGSDGGEGATTVFSLCFWRGLSPEHPFLPLPAEEAVIPPLSWASPMLWGGLHCGR